MKQKLIIFFIIIPIFLFSQVDSNQYIVQYNKEKDTTQKYEMLKKMREMKNPLFNSLFLDIISKDNPYNLKREALQGLEDNSDGPNMIIADKTAKLLQSEQNPLVIEAILHLLGKIGMTKHTSLIIPFLSNEDAHVREASVQALYNIGDKSCITPVAELLQKEKGDTPTSRNIRKFGMLVLSKFEDNSSLSELEQIFQESSSKATNNDESLYALNAIKQANPKKAKEIVIQATNSIQNTEVKTALIDKANVHTTESVQSNTEIKEESTSTMTETNEIQEQGTETPLSTLKLELTQEEVQNLKNQYESEEKAKAQLTKLSNLANQLKEKIQSETPTDEDYSFLGDIYLKIGDITKNLKDKKTAKENYKKAKQAYKKNLK